MQIFTLPLVAVLLSQHSSCLAVDLITVEQQQLTEQDSGAVLLAQEEVIVSQQPTQALQQIDAETETDEDTSASTAESNGQSVTSASYVPPYKLEQPFGKMVFLLGTFLTLLAVCILWRNERKAVGFVQLIDSGRTACKAVDPCKPDDEHDFDLVHISGTTHNKVDLCDRDFSVVAKDSYRLKRKVEVFQWREAYHEAANGQNPYYTYSKLWSQTPIYSQNFKNPGFENPTCNWPYRSSRLEGDEVMLGNYTLNASQVARLGTTTQECVTWSSQDSRVLERPSKRILEAGFGPFRPKGKFLMAAASTQTNPDVAHIGQMRVSFEYERCSEATLIAQQITNKAGQYSFRAWNPEKLTVPIGEEEVEGVDPKDHECFNLNTLHSQDKQALNGVIDYVAEGANTPADYFGEQEMSFFWQTQFFRFLGLNLAFCGSYLVLAPIVLWFEAVPFVAFLVKSTGSLAALALSPIVGLAVSLLVMAPAWLLFRPLLTVTKLVLILVSLYFLAQWDGTLPFWST